MSCLKLTAQDDTLAVDTAVYPELDGFTKSRLLRMDRFEFDGKLLNCVGYSKTAHRGMTMLGLEGRYNLKKIRADVAFGCSLLFPVAADYGAGENTPLGAVLVYGYWMFYTAFDYSMMFLRDTILYEPYVGVAAGYGTACSTLHAGFDEDSKAIETLKYEKVFNVTLRAGVKVHCFRLFFEQHFNTDNETGSYLGLTLFF